MSDLKEIAVGVLVFFLLVPVFAIFYTEVMTNNGVAVTTDFTKYNGTSYINLVTKNATNATQITEQPTGSGLDFFFGLPALFLQTGVGVMKSLYQTPGLLLATFTNLDAEFPGYYIGTLGSIVVAIIAATLAFLVVYFMRGYRA